MKNLAQVIADTQIVPPAFALLPRLLKLLEDPESHSEEIADIIRLDPGLTAGVLRVCNSARYAGAYRVETLQEGVMRLGLREVYRVVANIVTSPLITAGTSAEEASLGDLWLHSLAAAVAGHDLGRECGADAQVVFTAGLLHDIGKVIIRHAGAQEYTALLQEADRSGQSALALEKAKLRMNHAEAGGLLLKRWNFPEGIIAAVQFHHHPAAAKEHGRMAALTQVADVLARRIGQPYGPDEPGSPSPEVLESLGLSEPQLVSLQYQVLHSFQKERATYS